MVGLALKRQQIALERLLEFILVLLKLAKHVVVQGCGGRQCLGPFLGALSQLFLAQRIPGLGHPEIRGRDRPVKGLDPPQGVNDAAVCARTRLRIVGVIDFPPGQ